MTIIVLHIVPIHFEFTWHIIHFYSLVSGEQTKYRLGSVIQMGNIVCTCLQLDQKKRGRNILDFVCNWNSESERLIVEAKDSYCFAELNQ